MELNSETPSSQQANAYFAGQSAICDDYLKHFLSPILTAANEAGFAPFTYNFTGYELRISPQMAEQLRQISVWHVAMCKKLMAQIADLLLETNGKHAEFLSTSIQDAKFSVRTYHGLKGSGGCKTLLDVAKLGSNGVAGLRMLGPKSVAEVRSVFIQAGCVELFDAPRYE